MSAITIPSDIVIKYDNDNILFEFPVPNMTNAGDFYFLIYDLTAQIPQIKTPLNQLKYNIIEGVVSGKSYIFRVRAFDTKGNRSALTSAVVVTVPEGGACAPLNPPVNGGTSAQPSSPEPTPEHAAEPTPEPTPEPAAEPIPEPAAEPSPEELAENYITAVIDNDPILEDQPQIITNYPGVAEPLYIYRETVILQFPEPKFVPAVNASKYIESKNNMHLAFGYQGRNKYDFDTMLKIRMGKLTKTLK